MYNLGATDGYSTTKVVVLGDEDFIALVSR